MDRAAIERALDRAEEALDTGLGLNGTGFWPAVEALRRDRELADRYAARVAQLDRRAFEAATRIRVPIVFGLLGLLVLGWAGGVTIFYSTVIGYLESFERSYCGPNRYECPPSELVAVAFLLGTGAMIYATHGLAHWIVGRLAGIRFTHVFLAGPRLPHPGLKTDYASYLRASPRARAVMHASGAVVTMVLPFLLVGASIWLYAPFRVLTWLLIATGVALIVANVVYGAPDWKKMRRELRRS
jgi:hypothetical protein